MSDKCPDIYQSTISLSCFSLSMQLLTINHCIWSQLSQCLQNVTQVFRQVRSACCVDKHHVMYRWMLCVGAQLWKVHTQMCKEHYYLYGCVAVFVRVCTHACTSLIQRGINPIHYLAGLRAAQSMALSVAADELPSLTRCIIQTCRRARLCLAFQSI